MTEDMRARRRRFDPIILLVVILTWHVAPPGTVGGCVVDLDRQAVDRAVEAEMLRQELVGVAIGLIRDGEVAYVRGYGSEDRENRIPVTERTMFRWASISKPLTAIAAAQLAVTDRLDLDADVRTLVPEFPDKGPTISTRQLLGHLGGVVHYRNGPVIRTSRTYESANPFESVILSLDNFRESPLVSEPGAEFNYTTHGFILASAAVERAGGQPFHSQVDERIATVLGLESLQPDYQWIAIPHRAVGYRKSGDKVVRSTDTDVSWKLGGGGFISNIGDLAAFAAALADESFITPAMRKLLFTPLHTTEGRNTGYGLGFRVRTGGEALSVSHTGAQEKVRGLMEIRPDTGDGIVILTNSEYGNCGEIARVIRDALAAGATDAP